MTYHWNLKWNLKLLTIIHLIYFTFGMLSIFALPAFSEDFTKGIRLESTQFGKEIIQQLKSIDTASNTTTQRKEHKSVISSDTLEEMMGHLGIEDGNSRPVQVSEGPLLEFKKRDVQKKSGFLNGTFTIYGRAAIFQNDGNLKTKIRMRVRIYLNVSEDFSIVERSAEMNDWVYLEIKIKNPTPEEKGGSNKYRIKLYDKDALKLFYADPHSLSFDTRLEEIKSSALALGNAQVKVDQVFDVIKRISQLRLRGVDLGREFIKPLEITNYVRESYSFTETDYAVPAHIVKVGKKIPKFLKFLTFHKTPDIQYQNKDIEYQITIDRKVKAFLPQFTASDEVIDISRYFDINAQEKKEAAYPENSVAIEFKEPVEVAILPFHFRSPIHQLLSTQLTQKMIKNILPGYQVDRGKAGHLSRGLNHLMNSSK